MMNVLHGIGWNTRAALFGVFLMLLTFGAAETGKCEDSDGASDALGSEAEEPAARQARTDDVATIDGIIAAYYEVVSGPAGESPDQERDRTLHHPQAWVAIANVDSTGKPFVNVMTLDDYYGDNEPRREGFWEWETDRVIQRSGNLAHVWSSYASAREQGGEPYTRGVNTITLFHDGERWWIMGWMFDQSAGQP